eukprot:gene12186-16321_t
MSTIDSKFKQTIRKSIDISSINPIQLGDVAHRKTFTVNIMHHQTTFKKTEYDANAQVIRKRNNLESLRESEIDFLSATLKYGENDNNEAEKEEDSSPFTIVAFEEEEEKPSILTKQYESWTQTNKALIHCIVVFIFVFLTWGLAFHGFKIGSDLAATSNGVIASVLIPDMVIYACIGSYSGMTDLSSGIPVIYIGTISCISAFCFETYALFAGRGGRLGTCSFIANVIANSLAYFTNPHVVTSSFFYDPNIASYSSITGILVFTVIFGNMSGVCLTYLCRSLRPLISPVTAGNASSMLLIIILDSLFSTFTNQDNRAEVGGSILQGSFVGMSALQILSNVESVIFLGLISSCVTLLLFPLFPSGIGGKRGFMALAAVYLFLWLCRLKEIVRTIYKVKFVEPTSNSHKQDSEIGVELGNVTS